MTKRLIITIIIVAALLAVLAGCQPSPAASESQAPESSAPEMTMTVAPEETMSAQPEESMTADYMDISGGRCKEAD